MVKAVNVLNRPGDAELKAPGEFFLLEMHGQPGVIGGMEFICPCGCGKAGFLGFEPYELHPCWKWDGNKEAPTLTPSVLQKSGCKWHGYLTAGEWVAC